MIWEQIEKGNTEDIESLKNSLNITPSLAELLVQRGIKTFEEAKSYFRPALKQLHDPFLMKDMNKAVQRLLKAVQDNESVLVYGDYDVDGTTSVALVYSYLNGLNVNTFAYIPDRYKEGYGLSYQGIDYAIENKIGLIVCLDCGIKALDKVDYANKNAIDIIICDHHRPGETIPQAYAILNPKQKDCKYPFNELCGCGIGFKLIQGLNRSLKRPEKEIWNYLDLVATAIGSDIVPINGENRILAYFGLKILNSSPRPGFSAILGLADKKDLTITDVVFIIGPRINAAGRMKHGLHAVELLIEADIEKATLMAKAIEEFNSERKTTDREITEEALRLIQENHEEHHKTTVVYQENWHKGVIGIVASRLTETYYRPTLVFTKSGKYLAASARSVKGFDVYNALQQCSDLIEQFGGHKYAAGLTIREENFKEFKAKFEDVVSQNITPDLLVRKQVYDVQLDWNEITPKFFRIVRQFAPFGPHNMKPVFRINNLQDTGYARTVGKDNEHLKCKLYHRENPKKLDAIGFGLGEKLDLLQEKKEVDILATLNENEWNGIKSLQFMLKDIKTSSKT
jgi:single-stranded-DNA-specific exonuclease